MNFLTLDEYLVGARKIMVAQNCGFLTNDEDAVAHVAYRMMIADTTWNGESSRETWRYNQAKYALMRLLLKRKKKKEHKILSLDYGWQQKELDDGTMLIERIQAKNYENIYDQFEAVCELAKNLLSDKQYRCLISYHRDHKTLEVIGQEMGISKQRVQQHISKGIEKLQKCSSKLG